MKFETTAATLNSKVTITSPIVMVDASTKVEIQSGTGNKLTLTGGTTNTAIMEATASATVQSGTGNKLTITGSGAGANTAVLEATTSATVQSSASNKLTLTAAADPADATAKLESTGTVTTQGPRTCVTTSATNTGMCMHPAASNTLDFKTTAASTLVSTLAYDTTSPATSSLCMAGGACFGEWTQRSHVPVMLHPSTVVTLSFNCLSPKHGFFFISPVLGP
jgi:hypothetical protein